MPTLAARRLPYLQVCRPFATAHGSPALPRPTTALLPAASLLVHRRPGPPLSFILGNAPLFVAFLDVLSLSLLLICVSGLIAAWHR